ncbi:hydroxyisourate hydrolase [Edaphobacter sp. HDX4]|uniref:hydroxyisourate hydrolase n=1 Tax=Edaphobacter sp. HDX4 TaxID=2794064 RepID=UPI002FE605A3
MNRISTHILDISLGKPASAVEVVLHRKEQDGSRRLIGSRVTDADGRCSNLHPFDVPLISGEYFIRFETQPYHQSVGVQSIYPFIEIAFRISESDLHLHIPLLLSPNGYTTYRGT